MSIKPLKVIITGSTGMVGEGVLHVCLHNSNIEKVLVITRKSTGIVHPKLKEVVHQDFYNLSAIENELSGYDACYFCLGVSSLGVKDDEYYKLTYTLTMHVAETLCKVNNNMVFCYVSGAGTDGTEKGKVKWARVKGKTENDLIKLPFKAVYAYRPGFIKPIKGLHHAHAFYKYILWMFPIGRLLFHNGFNTLEEVGLSMINITLNGYKSNIINGKDIATLAKTMN